MKKAKIDDQKLIETAVKILLEKLGPVETSRFLSLQNHEKHDAVKRHHNWQAGLQKEEFFKEIFGN